MTSEASGGAKAPRPARDVFKLVGTTVADKYAIDGVIGEGGYGVVYAARHLLIGRPIALKCMKPLGTSAEDTARATGLFLREAQVLFGMSHPGIVRLYDVGTLTLGFSEVPYAVLEVAVDNRHLSSQTDCHFCGLGTDDPAANDNDIRRRNSRNASEQNASAAVHFL